MTHRSIQLYWVKELRIVGGVALMQQSIPWSLLRNNISKEKLPLTKFDSQGEEK